MANGWALVRQKKFDVKNDYVNRSWCRLYEMGKEDLMCSELNSAIDKLNWHSNDLASENCGGMGVRSIWLPDIHDGTRLDISSVLVHLG